jgi:ABC-type antimicrobial peptide transport system permease subunit
MTKTTGKPPASAAWILGRTIRGEDRLSMLGDFSEIFEELARGRGRLAACGWYWAQVVRSIPLFILNDLWWGGIMLNNYLKIAFRNLRKHKGYSFINIVGLAVGMACTITILLWVQDELSFDRFHENADNLYKITVTLDQTTYSSSPWALIAALKKDYPEIEKGSWYYRTIVNTRYRENRHNERIALVSPEFFEMFTFPYVKGDPKTALTELNSVVVSERAAAKYFGRDDPVGKTIQLENSVDLTVTGVIKNVPLNSHLQFDLVSRPEVFVPRERLQKWHMDCPSYVLLSEGADYHEVVRKISNSINQYDPQPTKYTVGLQPLKQVHLYALNGPDPIVFVYIFSAVALAVLFIACINFMNLSTARSARRAKEIGLRKVIGAARKDVIKQFFFESILLSLLALFVAIVLVYFFLPAFNTVAEKQLTLDLTGNYQIGIGLAVIALITGLISGTYPSLYLSSFQPVTVIQRSIAKGGKGRFLRRGLIIFQFATAVILIISTLVILKQMRYIRTLDLGFDRDHIIAVSLDDELIKKYESVKKELLKNKDIINVSAANSLPLNIGNYNTCYWEGRGRDQAVMIPFVCVDYDYFETFDMKMVRGRSFSRRYPTDRQNYVINESAWKMTGYEDPVGKMYATVKDRNDSSNDRGVLVGVVKDFHGTSLHNEIQPVAFFLYDMLPKSQLFVRVNPSNIPATIKTIRGTLVMFSPGFIFEYRFLDDEFDRMYRTEASLQKTLGYFAFLAVFISCLGLFSLASFMAEQKTKEIAIRKVLGAKTTGIVVQFSKEIVLLVLLADFVAWPVAAYFMNRWMGTFAYRTGIGVMAFITAAVIALGIALLTVATQSIKAAVANPVDSLRYE